MVRVGDRAGAAAVGLLGDLALGDPPTRWHPVGWFGAVMANAERRLYRDDRWAGVRHAGLGTAIGLATGTACRSTALATTVCAAGRGLMRSADAVATRLEAGELVAARELLPALAGRDPSELEEKEIARAVVESVAENTVDAIVAPAWWALVAGARGVVTHRALNTMDAMVGHHNDRYERYGWAAARLDDLAAWVPARLTAALVAGVRPRAAADILTAVRTQAPAHPSPNAGVGEAAYAAALGLQLGGTNRYGERTEHRPALGFGRSAEPADIRRATALCRDLTLALVGCLTVTAVIGRSRR
jgi:adenosylcobinamide-phosphate synthase